MLESFPYILLVLNCILILLFKKYIGPKGIFYSSIITFMLTLLYVLKLYINITINGSFYFLDLGR